MNHLRLPLIVLLLAATATGSISAPADARKAFEKSSVAPAEDNMKEGLVHMRKGNYEAAADSFQQAIYFSRANYNPDAWKLLGLAHKAMRNNAKAIEALTTHLKQTTEKSPDAHLDLAEIYINMKDLDTARKHIDKAYQEQTLAAGTYRQKYMFGLMHEKIDDAQGKAGGSAIGFYNGAINEKPTFTPAWLGKGRVQVKAEDYNNALKTYREILDKGPLLRNVNFEELYYNMGQCMYKRGDHQGALDRWRMALEANPESYDAHLALATMFDEERHYSSAVKEYEATLRILPPDNPERQKIMRRMQWLALQTKQVEAPAEVRPSPSMRQEFDQVDKQKEELDKGPIPKDSGF